MKEELEWVRQNPKGRQAKSKARLARFEELQNSDFQAQQNQRDLYPARRTPRRPGDRGGEPEERLRRPPADDGLTFNLPKGGIVGVIGPNGAGKTTLFRLLTGEEKPDGGELRIGPRRSSSPMSIRAATH